MLKPCFNRLIRLLGILLLFTSSLPPRLQAAESWFSKGPYVQSFQPDAMSVMWEAPTNSPALIRYGLGGQLDQSLTVPEPRKLKGISSVSITNVGPVFKTNTAAKGAARITSTLKTNVVNRTVTNNFFVYETILEHLRPGTAYSYSVELNGERTPPQRFTTLDPGAEKARFIVYGDTRSDPAIHASMARRFQAHTPDFILHSGDLVARGKDYALWGREFFGPMGPVIRGIPFFSTIGNHEEDGTNYLAYFHLPGKELWYSFDAGPVHVVVLDYHFDKKTSEQFKFAREDLLASRAPWKLVILHYPVFNIGGHATGWGHTDYLPLFFEARVDVLLAGHSHIYEHFRPVATRNQFDRWAITPITTGGGGANIHQSFDHPALLARESVNHYVLMEADRELLRIQAFRASGTLLDHFELRKPGGRPTAQYLASACPVEPLKLVSELTPSLTGKVAAVPRPDQPVWVMFSVPPRKQPARPAQLEILLTPESREYYEILGGPVAATTPGKGATNVVWTAIRATGKAKVAADKDQYLVPPLNFQARVVAAEGETLVAGARCKVSATAAAAAAKMGRGRP